MSHLYRVAVTILAVLVGLVLVPRFAVADTRAGAPRVERFAVVVGNNLPERDPSTRLRYADDDAIATYRLLNQAGVKSVLLTTLDEDTRRLNAALRPDGAPRLPDLEHAILSTYAQLRQASAFGNAVEFLFFFSGHGDVDGGEGYAVLEDGRLTRSKLYSLLAASPARNNHVFVDACKSFYLVFGRGPGGTRTPYAQAFAERSLPSELSNTGFVLSTSSGRESHEWERYQAGILSHELRSALRGAADANGDGAVTYLELGAFLQVANAAITNPRYRPDFLVRPPLRNLQREILRWPTSTTSLILFNGPSLGHVYVESASGERVADAHLVAGQKTILKVPEERPLYMRSNDERAEFVISDDAPAIVVGLLPVESRVASRGSVHEAFERLFADPFGPRDVADFESQSTRQYVVADNAQRSVDFRHWSSIVAATVAIGTAATGGGLLIYSMERSQSTAGLTQVELTQRNQTIKKLDIASAALFGVSLAAGTTWGVLHWWPDARLSVHMDQSDGRQRSTSITFSGAF